MAEYWTVAVSTGTEHYILGTDGKIDLNIEMSNSGEDSYLTSLNITLPDGVSYVNVVPTGEQCIPIACTQVGYAIEFCQLMPMSIYISNWYDDWWLSKHKIDQLLIIDL